ncbi:MAG: sugar phosphate isomerase/epimerase family protein [Chloroflexota bacterium]
MQERGEFVADTVLLSADRNNIEDCIDLAVEFDLGLEIMLFAYPDVLDGNWRHDIATYKSILRPVRGPITMHGPFMDMVSGSPDAQINALCNQRYQHAIYIASELEIGLVNLHANFIGSLHNPSYRQGWHKRNVPFWHDLAEFAREYGVIITLENMWEFEPTIISDILHEANHPNLKACLDVGHAEVFGDVDFTLDHWIGALHPYLVHTHLNNNNGVMDEHHGFDWEQGVLNYNEILPRLRAINPQPNMVMEMWHVEDMRRSLHYFELAEQPITRESSSGD